MKKLILLTLIMSGCASNSMGPIPTSTYDEPGQLQCSRYGLIEYCEGSSRNSLMCHCVRHNDFSDPTNYLWQD